MFKYFKDNRTGLETPFTTSLHYGQRGSDLFFRFECENSQHFSAYSENNEPIYLGDVVEVFIGAGKNPEKYYELEVAPNGTKFFAGITNSGGELKVKLIDPKFDSEVEITDSGYKVSITLPEKIFGDTDAKNLYFNAFRIETEGGETEKNLLALSPTLSGTFHDPKTFIPFDED